MPHLHALQHVEEVVHAGQGLHVLKHGDQQSGDDSDGASEEDPGEARPLEVQEALHRKSHTS